MATTTFKMQGFKELDRALHELSQKEAKKIGRRAVRVAAKPVLDAARAAVPVNEGRLKRALYLRVDTLRNYRSIMSAIVKIKFNGNYRDRKTGRWSTVKGKLGPPKFSYQIGSDPQVYGFFREFGIHGPAQPFMRPAWDAEGGHVALNRLAKELGEGLERAARDLGRRG